jgi:hypothetical protein
MARATGLNNLAKEIRMKTNLLALAAALTWSSAAVTAGDPAQAVAQHVEAARRAAGTDHGFIFGRLCEDPIKAIKAAPPADEVPAELPGTDPARKWYAEPARVFDDLFFLGQTVFSVWGPAHQRRHHPRGLHLRLLGGR